MKKGLMTTTKRMRKKQKRMVKMMNKRIMMRHIEI